jgi:hypothetical protein
VRESLDYIDELDPISRVIVRSCYEKAVQAVFWFATGVSVFSLISSYFIKEKTIARAGSK